MRIAVVGGGRRCKRLMEVIEQHSFVEINPRITAVADPNPNATGYVKAQNQGLWVTADYNDYFRRDDIDLIIELTDNMDIYNDILSKKSPNVRAISTRTAQLFWEISRVSVMQKKCHQELQETRAMYQTVINDLIQEDVIVIDYDHRIIDINERMLNNLGRSRDEVIGRPCYEITHHQNMPCSGEHHPCPLIETMKTERPSQTTHIHRDKDNREIYYSISTYPLMENEEVIGAIEISRDITRDINMQKVMMQQEKLASIGRLSAGVAHEINNPLTTILTTAMLIEEDLDPKDPMLKELKTIANEALRCRRIVTSLLDFARQQKPRKETCDINRLVEETMVLINKQALFKDIYLEKHLDPDLPLVKLDKGQIQQALINLAINAIEAVQSGGCVEFTTRRVPEGRLIEIVVSDNGPGIPPDVLSRIIDPFYTTKETGSGLGLAITHGIVEQHGGKLDFDSTPGQGSRFIIRLPTGDGAADAE
jgi:PAS domain S-box-containing protein